MEIKDYLYILTITITLVLGMINLIYNWRISRKTRFVNCVTAERVKWISTLRENIADFCGLSHHFHWSPINDNDKKDIFSKIDRLRMRIQLQLNPDEEHSRNIINLLTNKIPNLVGKTGGIVPYDKKAPLDKALDELVSASQLLLKEEWKRVKKEAIEGDITES